MQPLRYSERSTEDVAITSLLQIDFKQEQQLNSWQDPLSHKSIPKRRAYSLNKTNQTSQRQNQRPHIEASYHIKSSKSNLQLALLKELSYQSKPLNPHEDNPDPYMLAAPGKFNQGDNWSSRANWMLEKQYKNYNSQPKLNKKFSFGYEVNCRKNSQRGQGKEYDDKTQHKQYKTNLIYSLITNKQLFQNKGQGSPKFRNGALPFAKINGKGELRKSANFFFKSSQKQIKKSNLVQACMRQTLKKLYLKNHIEGFPLTVRQSQQSSIVRELLINIENIKDSQSVHEVQFVQADIDYVKQNGKLNSKLPQRKLHHIHHDRHILNLNQQAEKVYQGRSIHHNNSKPHSIKAGACVLYPTMRSPRG